MTVKLSCWFLLAAASTAAAGPAPDVPPGAQVDADLARRMAEGGRAFDEGRYPEAARLLADVLADKKLKSRDAVLYRLAESEFFAGRHRAARKNFETLGHRKDSRFAAVARFRVADCLWAEGRRKDAVSAYKKLVGPGPGTPKDRMRDQDFRGDLAADRAVGLFRIADFTAASKPAAAEPLWRALVSSHPGHPLADEAARRLPRPPADGTATARDHHPLPVAARLERARRLSADKQWDLAIAELEALPADLAAADRDTRDYLWGRTKFRMRKDYGKAGDVLLAVAPRLHGDEREWAWFHGARALSRADRDDEAIRSYQAFVDRFPRSRFAAEAQYLSGWLDFNRGRYQDGLPHLRATLEHFGSSPWADDAAWFVFLSQHFLGQTDAALQALDAFARRGQGSDGRVAYWRGRLLADQGKKDESVAIFRKLVDERPLGFYGLLAQARLRAAGLTVKVALPRRSPGLPPVPAHAGKDPTIARVDELLAAGWLDEAGLELERGEAGVRRRLGQGPGLAVLFDRYPRGRNHHRPYRLAEGRAGSEALQSAPEGDARPFWEAAYPRAYADLVDRFGPPAGNPDHFLFAVMRKESGFAPHVVSYADARGLLQMIPPTSVTVARTLGMAFDADDLYSPETNVRLGAAFIGSLFRQFKGQIPLVAGAFNAGPRAMRRWCAQNGKRPLDEFVELIAFKQTREYAKLVTGIYARYRYLYGPAPLELPLVVDARVVDEPAAPAPAAEVDGEVDDG